MIGILPPKLGNVTSGEWRYIGKTTEVFGVYKWTDGTEKLRIYWKDGADGYSGYVVEVERDNDSTLKLSNGFVSTFSRSLVLADIYMRDDAGTPSAMMHSPYGEEYDSPGSMIEQSNWLDHHADEYDFTVVKPEEFRELL